MTLSDKRELGLEGDARALRARTGGAPPRLASRHEGGYRGALQPSHRLVGDDKAQFIGAEARRERASALVSAARQAGLPTAAASTWAEPATAAGQAPVPAPGLEPAAAAPELSTARTGGLVPAQRFTASLAELADEQGAHARAEHATRAPAPSTGGAAAGPSTTSPCSTRPSHADLCPPCFPLAEPVPGVAVPRTLLAEAEGRAATSAPAATAFTDPPAPSQRIVRLAGDPSRGGERPRGRDRARERNLNPRTTEWKICAHPRRLEDLTGVVLTVIHTSSIRRRVRHGENRARDVVADEEPMLYAAPVASWWSP
ncbi:hypothetical protein AURDEDRAFT_165772 [Auricularia subglabra TFB-10046 SS5]|nr:hypothetical protein AURDEDRAFT_165772 [Auricularia subglabra TFB-10046 SS5]